MFATAAFLCAAVSGCSLFLPRYELSLVVEGGVGGVITAEPVQNNYIENSVVKLKAVPDTGWAVDSWTGVEDYDGDSAGVLMDMNRRVMVKFEPELDRANPSDDLINPPAVGFSPTAADSWTFMVYLDGDNNLDQYSVMDFNEIKLGLETAENENITVVALYDRWAEGGSWSDSRIYRFQWDSISGNAEPQRLFPGGSAGAVSMPEGSVVELNMGDPGVLADFISYCTTVSDTEHYALVLWNHGGGSRSMEPGGLEPVDGSASRLICQDENTGTGSGSDYLFTDELQQAVSGALSGSELPNGIELIGIDACLMGTVEAAYEMRNLTDYYVASMADENVYGWRYDDLFGRMRDSAAADAESLSMLIVDSFRNTAPFSPVPTLSAVRTAGLEQLKIDIDVLAAALCSSGKKAVIESIRDQACDFFDDDYEVEAVASPYHDLNDLCTLIINNSAYVSAAAGRSAEDVLESLSSVVVSAYAGSGAGNYYGSGSAVSRGLSIFFSKGNLQYKLASHYAYQYWYTDQDCSSIGPYGHLDFCTSDTDGTVESWREMHEAWYDAYSGGGYTPGSW